MIVICAWCGKVIGKKEGEGISHTICNNCAEKEGIIKNDNQNCLENIYLGTG